MTVKEFVTKWKIAVDDSQLKKLDHGLDAIKSRIDAFIGFEVAKGLFHLGEQFSKLGEQISLGAQSTGLAVEEFQKLAYAAKLNNVEQDEMQHGLTILSKQLYAARTGSKEAAEAFQKAGFTKEQVFGFRTSSDALKALSDRFSVIQDPIKKTALAQELLGRGSQRMVGLLSKGSGEINRLGKEAEKFGVILNAGQVENLERLENTLQKLWAVLKSLGALVAATIAPAIIYLVNAFTAFIAANRQLIQTNIIGFLKQMAYSFGFVFGFVEALTIQVLKLARAFGYEGTFGELAGKLIRLVGVFFALKFVIGSVWSVFKILAGVGPLFRFLPLIITGLWSMTAALGAMLLPLLPWVAGLGLAVVAIRDLWALFNNKPTWTGQALGKVGEFLGLGGAGNNAPAAGVLNNSTSSPNYSVNAPISITVPEGTNPGDVGKSVKEGVAEHLNRVLRETTRSTAPTVAY